jgi:hypothetical protein
MLFGLEASIPEMTCVGFLLMLLYEWKLSVETDEKRF